MPQLNFSDCFQKIDAAVSSLHHKFDSEKMHMGETTSIYWMNSLPLELQHSIAEWQFGSYGWTSPTNLFITAAWTKWFIPTQNVCKIWAADNNNNPIEGGYSIRSYDESVTVPIFTKHSITKDYCSPNSGMQGSRAIEKAREYKEIKNGLAIRQRVLFDMDLFVRIMTSINMLSSEEAKRCFFFFFVKGLEIHEQKAITENQTRAAIRAECSDAYSRLMNYLQIITDPEFVRAVCGCLCAIRWPEYKLMGIADAKTAANARSLSPGDVWLADNNGNPVIAIEAKSKGIQFGWKDLSNAASRTAGHPSCVMYLCITADSRALDRTISEDDRQYAEWMQKIDNLKRNNHLSFFALTLQQVAAAVLTSPYAAERFFDILGNAIVTMPGLSKDTLQKLNRSV